MEQLSITEIKKRIIAGGRISFDEAVSLSKLTDKEPLYQAADEIREHFVGNKLDMCSIVNAKSGKCSEDCKWCSQSAHFDTEIEKYDIVEEQYALDLAKLNSQQGVDRYSLVTSGRSIDDKRLDQLLKIYEKIGAETDMHLCASMGLVTEPQLQKLKNAGISHYHCNIETAPSHFATVCSTHTIDEKIVTIKNAQKLGIGVCSGGILGMNETMEQRIEMAFTLCELQVQSIPLNILNPVEGTAMAGADKLSDEEILTSFALFRLINPSAHIRFAGGRNLFAHIQEKALRCGISAALVGDYLTTLGTKVDQDKEMFCKAGFELKKQEENALK